MQVLGMMLPHSSINLPLNITFPIYKRPSLHVTVWGRGVPAAIRASMLTIKAGNITVAPTEVTGVYAGFI